MPDFTVRVNGKSVAVAPGTLVIAAIARAGVSTCRRSVAGELRGPLCGMGICFECRAVVNGTAHVRTCLRLCEPDMEILADG